MYKAGVFNCVPDKVFVPFFYRVSTGKKLNMRNPKTFNEKIQWLKVNDHNPIYTILVDKYNVREYVKNVVGEKYLIPLIGHWEKIEDIDFDILPNQFVLKCNHDSGGIIICNDKRNLDIVSAKKRLNNCMKLNHYYLSREWAYKDVKPQIIAEKYMIDDKLQELMDYKFFCFDGEPKIIQVDFDRFTNHKRNLYTLEWRLLDMTIKYPNNPYKNIQQPEKLNEMIEIARKLSCGLPEVRVDLYYVNGEIYFGEMTLYHGGGIEKFGSDKQAEEMGSWININKI